MVDLAHDVTPFDVRAGALMLERAVPHLGPGVVLAVVDPGVGTGRRAVVVSVAPGGRGPRLFVGPDNGLLAWAVDDCGGPEQVVVLAPVAPGAGVSTFDGRDLFAPAAARLWSGSAPGDLGAQADPGSLVRLTPPRLALAEGALETEVLWVDRFGNVQLSARPDDARAAGLGTTPGTAVEVVAAGGVHRARWAPTFAALGPDDLGAMQDANGRVALACDRRSAATVLGVRPGDVVTLRLPAAAPERP